MTRDWIERNAAMLRLSTHPGDYLSGVDLVCGHEAVREIEQAAGTLNPPGSKYTFNTMKAGEARILEGDYGAIRTAVSRFASKFNQTFRTEKHGAAVLVERLA